MLTKRVRYAYSEDESPSFEFTIQPIEGTIKTRRIGKGRATRWVVGYLAYDSDPQDPQDDDGNGTVRSLSRRHVNSINESEVIDFLNEDNMAVPLSYFEHGQCAWMVQGDHRLRSGVEFQWDGVEFAGVWVPDECARDNIKCNAMGHRLPGVKVAYKSKRNADGTIDDKNLNIITVTYEDGTEKGGYKTFESAYRAAAKKLGVKLDKMDDAIRRAAYEYAKGCVETYTDYCNGDCYGYVVAVFDSEGAEIEERDSCWGIYGVEYAESERDSAMASVE